MEMVMTLENAQSAMIQSDATWPSPLAGRVFHRVHGGLDPTGCVGALLRSVKRMLGLYNYIEPFFSEYGISATQGARPQSACDGPGGSEP